MDPAEIRFFWLVFIKERGADIFRKIRPSPILWELFTDSESISLDSTFIEVMMKKLTNGIWNIKITIGSDPAIEYRQGNI